MKEQDFSENNTHHENVKISIDKILGQQTSMRSVKKSKEDHKKILFTKIIDKIDMLTERSAILDEQFDLDLTKYETPYMILIDELLELSFNKKQINLINFYLYDRYGADGTITQLVDENQEIIVLESAGDLYELLKMF